MKLQDTMNYISVAVITFLIAYLLSHAIIRTIDERLTDISINMPQIVLPKHLFENRQEFGPTDYHVKSQNQSQNQKGGNSTVCTKSIDPRTRFDTDKLKSKAESVKKVYPKEIPVSAGQPLVKAKNNKTDIISYYINPVEMTPGQIVKFKQFAKPYKMTLTDYSRWLLLFKDDPENLERMHRDKLLILVRGGQLTKDDLPVKQQHKPPQDGSDWWNSHFSYNKNIPAPEVPGNKLAYNYADYQYHEDPKNLKHMTYINPDELIKHDEKVLVALRGRATKKLNASE